MSSTDMLSQDEVPAMRGGPLINRINRFLATPEYIVVIALLTVLSNILSMELIVYSIFTMVFVYVCIWGGDVLPLMPIFVCCYIAPSTANNPGRNEQSVFFAGHGGIYIACLGGLIAAAVIYRVIRDRRTFFNKKYKLLIGMLILLGAYLLGGLGSPGYRDTAAKNLLIALLEGGSIIVPYFLFSGGVNWKEVRKDYFAWIGFCLGGVLMCQILWAYLTADVVIDGVIHRGNIYTGWGIHNNLGGMLAIMIPFAFYLATKYHRGWIGTVVGSAFLIGVVLSCSRNAIITGSAIYLVCVILMLYYARNRKGNTIAIVTCICVTVLTLTIFHRQILTLFSDLLDQGLSPNSRDSIYYEGLKLFAQHPIFGVSFFSPGYEPWGWSTTAGFTGFFPPRWHNTIIQLLASCGIVGLGAYLFHRVQTVCLFLRGHSKEKTFIGCSMLVLLICSMFDCHFFNIGPTMFYAMALAFMENCPGSK